MLINLLVISNNVTVELVDKNTGSVIETVQITETSSNENLSKKTKQASNGELTLYVVYGTLGKKDEMLAKFVNSI